MSRGNKRPDGAAFTPPGFRVQGSGFRGQGSGVRVQGSGFRATRGPSELHRMGLCGRETGDLALSPTPGEVNGPYPLHLVK